MATLGTQLRVAIALSGKSGRAVAQRAGISPYELSRFVNDRKAPDEKTVASILRALTEEGPRVAA